MSEVKGTRIAFLGYTGLVAPSLGSKTASPAISFLDIDEAIYDIKEAQRIADLIVVSLHWGSEYETRHDSDQESTAKSLIDAGAHLIIGHHSHAVQEVEAYEGGYVAYGLGNFVFDQNFSPETGNGLLLKVTVEDKKLSSVEPIETGFNSSYQPFIPAQ